MNYPGEKVVDLATILGSGWAVYDATDHFGLAFFATLVVFNLTGILNHLRAISWKLKA